MAMMINEDCINCSACEPACPREAISEGDDIYIIDPEKCTECEEEGEAQCVIACPVDDCIVLLEEPAAAAQ